MSEARARRVADQIQREIATLVTNGSLKDDRIGFVTITGVEVTPDLREARVWFVAHGSDAQQAESAAALQENRGRLRSHIGREMKIRHAPELTFSRDKSIDEGMKIEGLLKEIRDKEGRR
jgi:ribosome-binding factor A